MQRIERAYQKRITVWVRQSSKRRDDLKEEKFQLAAIKMKKEPAKRKFPSPDYLINMDPSSRARKILSFPEDHEQPDSDPSSPQDDFSTPPPYLAYPTLASSLKK